MNYYFFIYIWKEIYIINMIQSQPKLCDFVSLSDTYIQVVGNCTKPVLKRNRSVKKHKKIMLWNKICAIFVQIN